jgi:uncharacterized protein (TIGR02246 family)
MRTVSVLVLLLLAGCQTLQSPDESKREILAASQAWADAFNKRDVGGITALYDPAAVLWGTSASEIAATPESIRQYFVRGFGSPLRPTVAFGDQSVRVHGANAHNSGSYTFSIVRDGKTIPVAARFSFAYRRADGRWLIIDHHSSLRPAPPKPPGG